MHKFACFNDEITDYSNVNLPAITPAAFYGRGVFTTVAVYNSSPFNWEKHWRRLTDNAATLGIDINNFRESEIKNSLFAIINRNNLRRGRARITFFDESEDGIWKTSGGRKTSFLITTANFRETRQSGGLRLNVSPFAVNSKSPLAGVKSCNYLENILALEKAKKLGFDEAVRLNEKAEITSAVMANIFWTRDGEIFTPPVVESGALAGTTREFILENFPVAEKSASLTELKSADTVFLTSAGIGVAAVQSIDEKKFNSSAAFTEIRDFFNSFKENFMLNSFP